MTNLAGLHDRSATSVSPPGTWVVDTVALSEAPMPISYPSSLNWIARLNWGYGSTGTIPNESLYNAYAAAVAAYVQGSRGCTRWIIGNEPNLSREWPNGVPIYPWHYAACFKLCRQAIHSLPGHENDEVLLAAPGPWNDECKYEGNPKGDWIIYLRDVMALCGFEGVSFHSYTHGYDVNLVYDTSKMQSFPNRYYNFLAYRDFCNAVAEAGYGELPAYLTEANGNGPWRAVGLIPAMLAEVDWWNHSGNKPQIRCLAFYRHSNEDEGATFEMGNKPDVMAEYTNAVGKGYMSPSTSAPAPAPKPQPPTEPQTKPENDYIVEWDARLDVRPTELIVAPEYAGWHVTVGQWFNESEAQGRVNVFLRVVDEAGQLVKGVPVRWYWSSGGDTKMTEIKNDPWLGEQYSLDFPMNAPAPSFGVFVADGAPSDIVQGLGLGSIEQPNYTIHTSYLFEFKRFTGTPEPPQPPTGQTQYVIAPDGANLRATPVNGAILAAVPYGESVEVDGAVKGSDGYIWRFSDYRDVTGWIRSDLLSLTPPAPEPPQPPPSGELVHPLPGAVITHHWGETAPEYKPGMWGHSGTDMGGRAIGAPIRAIADGRVTYVGSDPTGYGNFLQVIHDSLEAYSFYGHCDSIAVAVGQVVSAGSTIAKLGSTGNSSGPHLHLEIRLANEDGSYQPKTPMPQGRVDPETWCALRGLKL